MALFLLIHVVAGAVAAAAAVAVPLNLPRLLLLVFVVVGVVGVVGGGGSDAPLMARSLAANECQVTRVAPAAAAAATAAAGAAAETSANLTFHLECVSEKWGKITKLVKHSLISSMINIARAARVKGRNKVIRL